MLLSLNAAKLTANQPQQHPGIIGDHTGKGKQQEKCQLGGAGQFVNTLSRGR